MKIVQTILIQGLFFSTTSTALLAEALRGDFDLKQLVRVELVNRGLNAEGNWVGFDQAAKIHKIKKKG